MTVTGHELLSQQKRLWPVTVISCAICSVVFRTCDETTRVLYKSIPIDVTPASVAMELKMKTNIYVEGRLPATPQPNASGQPTPQTAKAPARNASAAWLVPVGLILLSVMPLAGGAFRLSQLASGTAITPANARFFASPLPVIMHIVSVSLFAILGAFQFLPTLRQRRNRWHRIAGWIVIPCGLAAALSGLWMTLFYPWPVGDGTILYGLRLLFGTAMLASILLGINAIRRWNYAQHGEWMLRGYAIGMGAGTQALTLMVGGMIIGPPSELSRALLMGAGWVINVVVAEWIIRRRSAPSVRGITAAVSYNR